MRKTPLVVDCDGGLDTLFGLSLLKNLTGYDLVAVTVCGGRYSAADSFANVAHYAALLGVAAPLYKGKGSRMLDKPRPNWENLGENGCCGLSIGKQAESYETGYAWDALYQLACGHAGELVLMTYGPLTNLALALFKYPDIQQKIKKVVLCGGSYDFGNYQSVVEINMAADPEAGRALFMSTLAREMVGHNAALLGALDSDASSKLRNAMPDHLRPLFSAYCDYLGKYGPVYCAPLLAAANMEDADILTYKRMHITYESKSELCAGRTVPIMMYTPRGLPEDTDVALAVDNVRFMETVVALLG